MKNVRDDVTMVIRMMMVVTMMVMMMPLAVMKMMIMKMAAVMMDNTEGSLHTQSSQHKKTFSAFMFHRSHFPQCKYHVPQVFSFSTLPLNAL